MNATDNIATDLFYKIRSRFRGLKLGSENGTITIQPNEARFFDFDYMEGETPIGHISISLAEPNSMKVYFSTGITEAMDTQQKANWYGFLRELRQFSKRRLMAFDTRDIAKDNLDQRDYAFLSQNALQQTNNTAQVGESVMNESAMYGTKTMSFQKLMDTRLIVKHSQALVDDTQPGARTRHISALFVENQDGERFKYPFIHLAGARAMQRHVANGGLPYDDVGKSIISMSEQIAQLKSFNNYVVRNDLMNSANNNIVERSGTALNNLREQIKRLGKQGHYEAYIENFQTQAMPEVPEEVVEDYTEKFTVKNFKEDIKSVFPVLYKLMQENDNTVDYDDIVEMTSEEDIQEEIKTTSYDPFSQFEEWAMTLGERSAIQDPEQQDAALRELNQLMGQHFPAGVDGTNAIESLKGIIDDPALYKQIVQASKEDPEVCVRPMVKQWLESNAPETLNQIDFGDMQEESAEDLVELTVSKHTPFTPEQIRKYNKWAEQKGLPDYDPNHMFKGSVGDKMIFVGGKGTESVPVEVVGLDPNYQIGVKIRSLDGSDIPGYGESETDIDWITSNDKVILRPMQGDEMAKYTNEDADGAKKSDVPAALRKAKGDKDWRVSTQDLEKEKERNISSKEWLKKHNEAADDKDKETKDDPPFDPDEEPSSDKDEYGNVVKHKARHLARKGMRQAMDVKELAEFISSFYDKDSGTFPKGPEGVATMVGKKFGEQAEQVARKMVERMAPQQADPAIQELSRIKELSGVQSYTNSQQLENSGTNYADQLAQQVFDMNPNLDASGQADELLDAGFDVMAQEHGNKRARSWFSYDEDFPSDFVSAYAYLQKNQDGSESVQTEQEGSREAEIQAWAEKYGRYRGANGDSLPEGWLQYQLNTGVPSDAFEDGEYKEMLAKFDAEEIEMNPEIMDEMPITKSMFAELNQIFGGPAGEDEAEMVNNVLSKFESATPELEDIKRLSGISQGLGF